MSLPPLPHESLNDRWLHGHWLWAWFFLTQVLWLIVALPLFDAIAIVIQLGSHAYFVEGVHVVSYHHGTLSDGSLLYLYPIYAIASLLATAWLMRGVVAALQLAIRRYRGAGN